MKDWHSEEEIKAQLRELTRQTRKLRSDLHALIRPSKPVPPRLFEHETTGDKEPPLARADERRPRRKPK